MFILHSQTWKLRKTHGGPASLSNDIKRERTKSDHNGSRIVKINVIKPILHSRHIYSHNSPSDLTHDLFTDTRWFKLVSNIQKMRSRKRAEEEKLLYYVHIDGDSLLHHHEPRQKTTKKQKIKIPI